MKPDIAGDPISGLKWTKKTTEKMVVSKSLCPGPKISVMVLEKSMGYEVKFEFG